MFITLTFLSYLLVSFRITPPLEMTILRLAGAFFTNMDVLHDLISGLLERYHSTRHHLGLDSWALNRTRSLHLKSLKLAELHSALSVRIGRENASEPVFSRLEFRRLGFC